MFFQSLFIDGDLNGIATETVNGIHKHDVPRDSLFAIGEHLLKSGAIIVRPRHGSVDICIHNGKPVRLCILVADMELPFNGLLVLFIT